VSVVTFGEIRFGIERLDDPVRRAALTDWLAHRVRPMFDGRILPVSEDVMLKWRILVDAGRKIGHTFSQLDLILGATALHYGLTMMLRDAAEYVRAGVSVTNPWLDPLPGT
jgi:predicted nucleic acid-binding protein